MPLHFSNITLDSSKSIRFCRGIWNTPLIIRPLRLVAFGGRPFPRDVKLLKAFGDRLAGVEIPSLVVYKSSHLIYGGVRPCGDIGDEAQEIDPNN